PERGLQRRKGRLDRKLRHLVHIHPSVRAPLRLSRCASRRTAPRLGSPSPLWGTPHRPDPLPLPASGQRHDPRRRRHVPARAPIVLRAGPRRAQQPRRPRSPILAYGRDGTRPPRRPRGPGPGRGPMSGPGAAFHEEEALGKAYDARLMRRLLRYLRPYRWRVAAAVAVLLAGAALELVGPWLTKVALDRAIPDRDTTLLAGLAVAYLVALALAFLFEYAQTLLTTWIGQRVMYDLRREIFGHLQRLSLPFFDRNPVGRLMTRVTNDVEVLNELFSSGVVTVFGDVFTLLFIVGAMFALDWRLALVTLA